MLRTKNMVGKVLANNGVVEPIKSGRKITGYRLLVDTLTEAQTASLINLCDKYIQTTPTNVATLYGNTGPARVGTYQVHPGTTYSNVQSTDANYVALTKNK